MQDLRVLLNAFMEAENLTQVELAKASNVSQSTVSRALRELPKRSSKERARLFKYAYIQLQPVREVTVVGKDRVLDALNKIWDCSEAHAAAVAKIIEALEGVLPSTKKEDA